MIITNSIIIRYIFEFIVNYQMHNTHTSYKLDIAQKLSIALFISNGLVTTFINIVYGNNIYGKNGLIYIMLFYFALD